MSVLGLVGELRRRHRQQPQQFFGVLVVSKKLTVDNIDDAWFDKNINAVDSLRRIAGNWMRINLRCVCKPTQACPICEIDYLLDEAFRLPEHDS